MCKVRRNCRINLQDFVILELEQSPYLKWHWSSWWGAYVCVEREPQYLDHGKGHEIFFVASNITGGYKG